MSPAAAGAVTVTRIFVSLTKLADTRTDYSAHSATKSSDFLLRRVAKGPAPPSSQDPQGRDPTFAKPAISSTSSRPETASLLHHASP